MTDLADSRKREDELREQLAEANKCIGLLIDGEQELKARWEKTRATDKARMEAEAQLAALRLKCDEAISACASETCAMAKKVAAVTAERDDYSAALESCRSSVKFDLNRYERMILDYKRLCPEGEDKLAVCEPEANRLCALIDTIDALVKHSPEDDIEEARRKG